jgi:RHS repeat-associated protein
MLERLEDRRVLAIVTWINAEGGDWADSANWSDGAVNRLPAPADDAVIPDFAGDITIMHSTGNNTINSLTSAEKMLLSGGSLTVTSTVFLSDTFTLQGGTLRDATVQTSGGARLIATNTGGTLDGVTINGELDLTGADVHATVTNGLILNGTARLAGNFSHLLFAGTQTLAGNGVVAFEAAHCSLGQVTADATLTLGPDITVRSSAPESTLGFHSWYGPANVDLVNEGTIIVDGAGATLHIDGRSFINLGSVEATNGGHLNLTSVMGDLGMVSPVVGSTLSLDGDYVINQPLEVGVGAILNLNGAWTNTSTVRANEATVNLGGTFTLAALGVFERTGGTVNVVGTLDNDVTNLVLDGDSGSWRLAGGTLRGGTVTTSDGSTLVATNTGGTLDGVTINGELDLTGADVHATVTNGLILNGTARLAGNFSHLLFAGTQTLAGNGVVAFEAAHCSLGQVTADATLTLGPDITVRSSAPESTLGFHSWYGPANVDLVNEGTIIVDGANARLDVTGRSLTNLGVVEARNGGTLNFDLPLTSHSSSILASSASSSIAASKDLLGETQNASRYRPQGKLRLDGSGTFGAPQLLEVMGRDLGTATAGFADNFVHGALTLAGSTFVRLVDQADNSVGSDPEAIYVDSLIVPSGTTFDLNGLHLYTRAAQVTGDVIGGLITQVPDGGSIDFGTPTTGTISVAGELDEWRFFGRGEESISVVVNPGSGGVPTAVPPLLEYAEVSILDANDNVLATGSSGGLGAVVTLSGVTLPVDGVYRIQVRSPSSEAGRTGNYLMTMWNTTRDERALNLNQRVTGEIETLFSVDDWTFAAVAGQQVQFDLVNTSGPGLSFTLTGPGGYTAFADLTTDSEVLNLPVSGDFTVTARALTGQTGAYAFQLLESTRIDLSLGTPYFGSVAGRGQAQLFRVNLPVAEPLRFRLDGSAIADQNELYVKFGATPTRADYDYRYTASASADQEILVPLATPGAWYVLVYAAAVPSPPSSYTLTAEVADVFLIEVSPPRQGNQADATLTLTGAGFQPGTTVTLSANGINYQASHVQVDTPTRMIARFTAGSVPPGVYTVQARAPSGAVAERSNAFEMLMGGEAHLETHLVLPAAVGRHSPDTLYVEYANTGTIPMPAPLLVVRATDRALMTLDAARVVDGFWTSAVPDGYSDILQILGSGATPGVLQPGEHQRIPIYYAGLQLPWDDPDNSVTFTVEPISANSSALIDWNAMKDRLRPPGLDTASWDVVYNNLQSQVGATWGDYLRMLSDNAAHLWRVGQHVVDVGELWRFEVLQAIGMNPVSTLTNRIDADVQARGLSLTLGRRFSSSLVGRQELGLFGRGWSLNCSWDWTLHEESDGTVVIDGPEGRQRRFEPDSRGGYFVQPGDHANLTSLGGGVFTVQEPLGLLIRFRSDGKIDFAEDPNGNRVTANYTGGQITGLSHSSGQSLQITYNAAGRIERVNDSVGRAILYEYDATNEHLVRVTDPGGLTMRYTYDAGGNAATEHALTAIEYGDGTHRFFTYDAQGRLASSARDGDLERVTYAYDSTGKVSAVNASGDSTEYFFDYRGRLNRIDDPLGRSNYVSYDADGNVTAFTNAAGQQVTYEYDEAGDLLQFTDVAGHARHFSYLGPFDRMTLASDARGNPTEYRYDAQGNLSTIIYVNGTVERFAYDPLGDLDAWTNRRGQVIDYAANANGQTESKTFPDGSVVQYHYNARGNLERTVDSTGTTLLEHLDPQDPDLVTRISYPNGKFLAFTYENGRRTEMVDQDGFTVVYEYDPAGRLQRLRDATNQEIVVYYYDIVGRLSRKELANGTYTTYAYDAAGQLEHLVNYAPDDSVNSRFDYTYDVLGRRTSMTIKEGTWTYHHDGLSQLTRAVFVSANPAVIPNQDLQYAYDAAGNRIHTSVNGLLTEYTVNSLNQYTRVGEVEYTYDRDGNLIARTDAGGVTNYVYCPGNRLVGVNAPGDSWTYEYNALGLRTATVHNGERTEYLIDPFGLDDVVAEYAGSTLTANYVHGIGLVSQLDSSGASSFYDFDAIGSTAGLTDAAGALQNRYSYLPFGEILRSSEVIPNPFQYVGALGVMEEGNGVTFMRNRFYQPSLGVFTSVDPRYTATRQSYQYANNNPLSFIDPSGLQCFTLQYHPETGEITLESDEPSPDESMFDEDPDCPLPEDTGVIVPEGVSPQADDGSGAEDDEVGIEGYPGICFFWPPVCNPDPAPGPPPDPAPGKPADGGTSGSAKPKDPNQKIGPAGYGPQHYLTPQSLLAYRIDFENDPTATAPAQRVVITDPLNSDLNWSTFQLTEVGFGDIRIDIPAASQYFDTTVPMALNGRTFEVEIEIGLNPRTGLITAVFQSIDSATGLPPDVLTGFLPPEDGTGRGMGYFSYIIEAHAGLPTGAEIRNVALITFDSNPSIATNQIDPHDPSQGTDPQKEALVTIDAVGPASAVNALLARSLETFELSWAGSDDVGGSGLKTFDVYSSKDGGPYALLWDNLTTTSAMFTGEVGSTYAFYSRAIDYVGHQETAPSTADTVTQVVSSLEPPWQNPDEPLDVNASGLVTIADLLAIVQDLRNYGVPHVLPDPPTPTYAPPPYVDCNGDGWATMSDLLDMIVYLRTQIAPAGSGEAESFFASAFRQVESEDFDRSPPWDPGLFARNRLLILEDPWRLRSERNSNTTNRTNGNLGTSRAEVFAVGVGENHRFSKRSAAKILELDGNTNLFLPFATELEVALAAVADDVARASSQTD